MTDEAKEVLRGFALFFIGFPLIICAILGFVTILRAYQGWKIRIIPPGMCAIDDRNYAPCSLTETK